MPSKIDQAKSERKRLYFDLICGIVSSILALTGIIFFAVMYGITNMAGWLTGLVFWILYLSLSIFMISIGVYTKYKERQLFGKS
ncbi:MAG: hypothetical protein ACFFA3_20880 [Promethearchaeota archaeon]